MGLELLLRREENEFVLRQSEIELQNRRLEHEERQLALDERKVALEEGRQQLEARHHLETTLLLESIKGMLEQQKEIIVNLSK